MLLYGAYLADEDYELLPAFVNGMLDAMGPKIILIEGHEYAYYWTSTQQWFSLGYENVRTTYRDQFIEEANHGKYNLQVQAGTAVYASKGSAGQLTETQRRKDEHNLFIGYATTDEYQFYYQDAFAFWPESDNPLLSSSLPAAGSTVIQSLTHSKSLFEAGQRLGYDLENNQEKSQMVVTIASPTAGSEVGASFTVTVNAPGADHVMLYSDARLNQEKTEPPFSFEVVNLPPGKHLLMVRAHHKTSNEWGTSQAVVVSVLSN